MIAKTYFDFVKDKERDKLKRKVNISEFSAIGGLKASKEKRKNLSINVESKHRNNKSNCYNLPSIKYTHSSVERIKKIDNVFKTDLKIRETINRELNKYYCQDNEIIDKTIENNIFSIKQPNFLIKESFMKRHYRESKPFSLEDLRQIKKDGPRLIPKQDYALINPKITYLPFIINDTELICNIYDDNMKNLNKMIENKKKQHTKLSLFK